MESTDRESISKHIFLQTDFASRRERCCQSPVRGEASRMAKAYVGRRPTPKAYAEGLQEVEVPREGGDSRGKRVGESIPDGWRQRPPLPQGEALRRRHLWKQDASPPAGRSTVSATP